MNIKKRIQNSAYFRKIASKIVYWVMRFAYFTTRWIVINKDVPEHYIANGKPFLVAMWHDRLMTVPCAWKFKSSLNVLASAHRDGRFIAQIVKNFKMRPIYGSTGRCTIDVTRKLVNACKRGEYTAIIPDGPRGPRHEVSAGIIAIAKLAKTDILVVSSAVKRFKKCNSWDQFLIAYPFNKGGIVFDILKYEDIRDIDNDSAMKMLKDKLDSASLKAAETLK